MKVNFDELNRQDIYSVASALLYLLKDNPKYKSISELFYLTDYDSFIRLIKYFGGQEIRIPTFEELDEVLRMLLVYQYSEVEGLPWKEVLDKSGIPEEESLSTRSKLIVLKKFLGEYKIGGRDYK
jgi:hypothetical protein